VRPSVRPAEDKETRGQEDKGTRGQGDKGTRERGREGERERGREGEREQNTGNWSLVIVLADFLSSGEIRAILHR
jgi:hypothetical protein